MGSATNEPDRSDDETQHRVTLSNGFWLGMTQVTEAQWQAVMGANPSKFQEATRPVEQVSWDECQAFLKKLSATAAGKQFRLPTEAEWEYAYRAGTQTAYYFGADTGRLGDHAWFGENSGSQTHDVGQKKPNAWGLYDMAGNVWEWCADWYGAYAAGSQQDPTGAPNGSHRVFRGGSRDYNAAYCRAASRGRSDPGYRGNGLGFRLALVPSDS